MSAFIPRCYFPGQWLPYKQKPKWMRNRHRYINRQVLRLSTESMMRYEWRRRMLLRPYR